MSTEEFQDFSYATHWEKFAGEIEQVLRRWLWMRENALSKDQCTVELKQKLHFRKESYLMSLQLPGVAAAVVTTAEEAAMTSNAAESDGSYSSSSSSDEGEDFEFVAQDEPRTESDTKSDRQRPRTHPVFSSGLFVSPLMQFDEDGSDLQRWFGISRFVLLRAGSQSGRILDDQEGSTILSAAAVALSEFPKPIPILIPLQNTYRDAYRGVAVVDGHSVFFDIDSSHLTKQPEHLKSVDGQLDVFAKQLYLYSPKAAQLCEDISDGRETAVDGYEVGVSSCVVYKLPLPSTADHIQSEGRSPQPSEAEVASVWEESWDDGCVWQPWATQKDPVAALELDLVWSDVELTPENPMPVLSAMNAAVWKIHALAEERDTFESWAIFSSKDSFARHRLDLPSLKEPTTSPAVAEYDADNFRSLSARLNALLQAVFVSESARSVGDLGSEQWWDNTGTRGPTIPPDDLFQQSISDMFGEDFTCNKLWTMTDHVKYLDASAGLSLGNEDKDVKTCSLSRLVPMQSLTSRLGLHAVVFRNARAVALLWGHFVQAIRLQYWEKLKLIPLLPFDVDDKAKEPESPDLNACLIHQKLQMLNVCIHRLVKRRRTSSVDHVADEDGSDYGSCQEEMQSDLKNEDTSSEVPRGVAGVLKGAFLEKHPDVPLNIPVTQLMPVHTFDSMIEEETLLSALHDSPEDRERAAKEQAKVLLSDMAAFKAANPAAQLEDFVKWHSPKDWVTQENGEGCLSQRMAHERNNRWMDLWNEVEARPASDQIPLFDPAVAGERALYFLETMEPVKLFWQLFQIALISCFGCLQRCQASNHKRIQQDSARFHKSLKEGLERMEYPSEHAIQILDQFKTLERTVVAGESLVRHLPGCDRTASLLLDSLFTKAPNKDKEDTDRTESSVRVPDSERPFILRLLLSAPKTDGADEASDEEEHRKTLCATVLQHEWIITCRRKGNEADHGQLCHRLYFKDAANEVRLGTVLVSDF